MLIVVSRRLVAVIGVAASLPPQPRSYGSEAPWPVRLPCYALSCAAWMMTDVRQSSYQSLGGAALKS
jgi:hypothetical protein